MSDIDDIQKRFKGAHPNCTREMREIVMTLLAELGELSDKELLKSCVIVRPATDLPGIWVAHFTDFNCITQGTSRAEAVVSLLDAARIMLKHSIPSSVCDMTEVVGLSAPSDGICGIPARSLPPCDMEWGHDGDLHGSAGDGFYARDYDDEHHRRQDGTQVRKATPLPMYVAAPGKPAKAKPCAVCGAAERATKATGCDYLEGGE
jgi:predicted RNase H-like HicB family nuclease